VQARNDHSRLQRDSEQEAEVGAGTVHWKEILAAAEKNGVKHFFVERDSGDLPAMESASQFSEPAEDWLKWLWKFVEESSGCSSSQAEEGICSFMVRG